jgi:hypothetical protein
MKRKLNNKQQYDRWIKKIKLDIDNDDIKNDLCDFLEYTRVNFFIKNTKIINNEEEMYNSFKLISDVYIQEEKKSRIEREKNKNEKIKMDLFFHNEIKKLANIIKDKLI